MQFSSKGILFISLAVTVAVGGFLFFKNYDFPQTATVTPPTGVSPAGGSLPPAAAEKGNQIVIRMAKDGFSPRTAEISRGDTVIFINEDKKTRWPASNIHPTHQVYPQFDPLQEIKPGESWGFKFERAGEWRYHDHLYPQLTGVITVSGKNSPRDLGTEEKQTTPPPPSRNLEEEISKLNMLFVARNESELRSWLAKAAPKRIMQELLNDSGGGTTLDCHQEAHQIGGIAYELYGATVFKDGDASCHSGFYHGAMEAFLAERGTANLAEDIEEVCNNFATGFGKFECLHGVGHGVLAYVDYDLPKAVETCRKLASDYEHSSCFGGMFMENIVTAQGLGALPGHKTEWANSDPQFPCNAIDQNYSLQYQCWQMQTSWMLTLFKYDFEKVKEACLETPPDFIDVCFKSYGRDAAGHTLRNAVRIAELCGQVPRPGGAGEKNYYEQCVIGAVNVIVDFWGEKLSDQAAELCRVIPEENGKRACYTTLASRLNDVFGSTLEKKKICDTFDNKYKYLCGT